MQSPSPHLYAKRHFIIKTRIPLIPYVWTSAQRNKKRLTPRSGEKRPIIVAGKTVGHQLFHFVPASFVPFFHKPRFEKAVSASIKQLEIDSYYISGPRHTPSCSRKSRQYVVPSPAFLPSLAVCSSHKGQLYTYFSNYRSRILRPYDPRTAVKLQTKSSATTTSVFRQLHQPRMTPILLPRRTKPRPASLRSETPFFQKTRSLLASPPLQVPSSEKSKAQST